MTTPEPTAKSSSDNIPSPPRRLGIFGRVQRNFFAGIVVVSPIALTLYFAWIFINFVDGLVLPFIPQKYQPEIILPYYVPGLGLVVFVVFVTIIGFLTRNLIGRTLIRWSEGLLHRMPIIRSVYDAIKQIATAVFQDRASSFRQPCLLEYPRRGIWAIGFISTPVIGALAQHDIGEDMQIVFLPTTPNPTSGFMLLVPKKDLILLNMSIEQAAKLVISAGLVDADENGKKMNRS